MTRASAVAGGRHSWQLPLTSCVRLVWARSPSYGRDLSHPVHQVMVSRLVPLSRLGIQRRDTVRVAVRHIEMSYGPLGEGRPALERTGAIHRASWADFIAAPSRQICR
jgi:hypothetical protein